MVILRLSRFSPALAPGFAPGCSQTTTQRSCYGPLAAGLLTERASRLWAMVARRRLSRMAGDGVALDRERFLDAGHADTDGFFDLRRLDKRRQGFQKRLCQGCLNSDCHGSAFVVGSDRLD